MTQKRKYRKIRQKQISGLVKAFLFSVVAVLFFVQCGSNSTELSKDPDSPTVTITPAANMDLYGFIGDSDGAPVPNVVVSDGYSCTITDSKGIYQMKKNSQATYVSYSTPSDYVINTSSSSVKVASCYAKIVSTTKRYDFTLKKVSSPETNFTLICIGDPQVTSASEIDRFNNETMKDIKAFIGSAGTCYALTMGDMAGDKPALFGQMKTVIGSSSMTIFPAIGNHDKVAGINTSEPRTTTDYSLVFGPVNYSFNRGNVHFISMDDIVFSNSSDYSGGFTSNQVEWLKQDLSYVSKDKMIILFYHIPLRGTTSIAKRTDILNALKGYAEVHLMCGHTHYNENYVQTTPISAYEHIHAAACGAWWRSTINGDGTPNGYAVYQVKGNTITNWYYKPTNISKDFQIRLHQGNVKFGGQYGYFSFDQEENTIVANIWNSDNDWKVEAYENGIKTADLTHMSTAMNDAWSLGYHLGVLNRDPDNYTTTCKHLYLYKKVNPQASFEIRATDRFGTVYSQKEITSDYTSASWY